MQRVLVIGSSGSGKSTLAKTIADRLKIPLIHLDHLFWKPGWVARDTEEFYTLSLPFLKQPAWVMDGNYMATLDRRLAFADTVIFLDYNRFLCAYRAIKRWVFQEGDQADGCPQKVDWPFLKYILVTYPNQSRPKTYAYRNSTGSQVRWLTFSSPKALRKWLESL